jgi:putative flippase GtrA
MTAILTNRRERTRFLRFVVVGLIGAVVDFGTANLLVYAFSAPLVLAGTISFIAAILSNFTWNRFWTYPDSRSKPVAQQLVQFTLVSVMGLGIRVPILHWLEPLFFRLSAFLKLPPAVSAFLVKNATLAVAVLVVMLWNFFANRYWTYGDVDQA